MPKRREPHSLRRTSMVKIAECFEHICYHGLTNQDIYQLYESGAFTDIIGPFFELPSSITDDLFEVIKETRPIKRHMYHQLIHSNTRTLLLGQGTDEIYYGLKFTQERCKNLRHLDLSYSYLVSPTILLDLFPHLPKLQRLNLKKTLAFDEVLSVIADNCPDLYDLDISSTPVTDNGLHNLCVDKEGNPRTNNKLCRLILEEVQVTYNGVFFILNTLRQTLADLEYDAIFDVMERDRKHIRANGDSPSPEGCLYKLKTLRSTNTSIDKGLLHYSVLRCPYVNHVILSSVNLPDEALMLFSSLKLLTSFSVTRQQASSLTFEKGVVPLLQSIGKQIKDLIICNFPYCDLEEIGILCPNIQKFAVSGIGRYENRVTRTDLYSKLLVLELWLTSENHVTELGLKQLLGNCLSMTNILVKGCETLSDDLFLEIWQNNPMRKLNHLTLDDCQNISVATITILLAMDNEIDFIRTWGCSQIRRKDWENVCSSSEKENMDLYFEWYE